MSQVTNLAFFAPGAALVEPLLEAGCLNYDLHRSVDDADVWFV
jgi:quinol monooxygenase YgiN